MWDALPVGGRLLVFVIPAAIFPLVTTEGNLFRYGLITLLYALLALGLNVVVGFAGLLDLGYIAFFGFGAYMYGILASGHSGHHWPAELAIPVVIAGGALLGLLVGLPSRRLVGDYLAIVTLFFGQAFVVFVNNANRINFPFVGHTDLTGGANGLDNIDPLNLFGWKVTTTKEYYYFTLGAFVLVMIAPLLRQRVADGPGLACAPRGSTRSRGDEHPDQQAQAHGVRLRARPRRRSREASTARSRRVPSPATSISAC